MSRVRLVLWDIDGTLVYFRGAGRRAAEEAFRTIFGIADVAARTREVPLAGSTDSRIMRSLAAACGIPEADYAARREEVRVLYLARLRVEIADFAGDPVLPGVRPLLAALAARPDVRQGLLTGNYEPGARIKLEPVGLNAYFPTGGFGDDHEDRRVVAAVARARMEAHHDLGVRPEDVLVVGDTVHDVDCAKAHGFTAVAVCTGHYDRATLAAAGADHVLDDLLDPKNPLLP